jgi:hypothetical protein
MKRSLAKLIGIRVAALAISCLISFMATYTLNRVYVRFERVAMGSMAMEPNGRGGVSSYQTSDGVNLSFEHLDFPSAEDAAKAFEKVIGAPDKVISKEFVRDREGQRIVGERVLALFPAYDGKEWPMMVCLDGSKLYQISSTSLRHILIFEKERRRY